MFSIRGFLPAPALAVWALSVACADAGSPEEELPPGSEVDPHAMILVGAGDIASCSYHHDTATAALLDRISGTVFTVGDNAYPDGSATNYAQCYEPTWGRHRSRTRPVPGGHDYNTPEAGAYFDYFGDAAGPRGRGYYSYDVGTWHVIALNSHLAVGPESEQGQWLRADLLADSGRCTIAYWHSPRFSSGSRHGSLDRMQLIWDVLYEFGVEIVMNGDEHHYERFAPQTPTGVADPDFGIRQFVVGTGGRSDYPFGDPIANSQVRATGTPGVLVLTLLADGYEWRFVPAAGHAFTDAGSGSCHDAPPGPDAS
ncbi:MAG TPA: metallophosphoesterase [Gemmatimonadales bacterium]|nr:metallophosphoesterase [Gemmatimonadales bacterium]